MKHQRAPLRPSLQQAERRPLATYDQAVNRLVTLSLSEDVTDEAYDLAVQVLSDVFWETETKMRADVIKARKVIGA